MRSSFEERKLLPPAHFVAAPAAVGPDPEPEVPAPVAGPPDPDPREALQGLRAVVREEVRAELEAGYRAELRSAIAALEEARGELCRLEERELESLRHGIVELGLSIARRVLQRTLDRDRDALVPLVGETLELLAAHGEVTIALAPQDLASLRGGASPELERLGDRWAAHFESDASLGAGESRVQAREASVELRLEALLERFREGLLERLPDDGEQVDDGEPVDDGEQVP